MRVKTIKIFWLYHLLRMADRIQKQESAKNISVLKVHFEVWSNIRSKCIRRRAL